MDTDILYVEQQPRFEKYRDPGQEFPRHSSGKVRIFADTLALSLVPDTNLIELAAQVSVIEGPRGSEVIGPDYLVLLGSTLVAAPGIIYRRAVQTSQLWGPRDTPKAIPTMQRVGEGDWPRPILENVRILYKHHFNFVSAYT